MDFFVKNNIEVVELFAGVGGFRVGLEESSARYKTIWANQWEPGKKAQHAFECYISHFGKTNNHVNEDISKVKNLVPKHDLLVGGFPCQDYSVARTGAQGITGKKGVLWWEINDILKAKSPRYLLLENVDRLIKSPSSQRGRDFGVILRCLFDLGYAVEWRVINAAEYGNAQRRRRIFIFAYHDSTNLYKKLETNVSTLGKQALESWIINDGFYAPAFPIKKDIKTDVHEFCIDEFKYPLLTDLSEKFEAIFHNSGVMINGQIVTVNLTSDGESSILLQNIRHTEEVDSKYFLNGSLEKWEYLKGAKKINRIRPNGEPYVFSEGGMCFPDNLDAPARTMLTSEASVNRSSHVIEDCLTGKLRLLTPVECERLNGFPDNWTSTGMPEKFRYFVMGNALVVPLVTRMGNRLLEIIDD
jgi:DNA-methyltransferase (dcm)